MDRVERVVYINLDARTDRRAAIEAECARMGIAAERFAAIPTPSVGGIGCALSHAAVTRRAAAEGVASLLVLEDDLAWRVDRAELDRRLGAFLDAHPDYDVVMLDYNLIRGDPPVDGVGRVHKAAVAAAYLVAGHYLARLSRCLAEAADGFATHPHMHWIYSCDQYWERMQARDRWYYLAPRVCSQSDGYSDICLTEVKHTYLRT